MSFLPRSSPLALSLILSDLFEIAGQNGRILHLHKNDGLTCAPLPPALVAYSGPEACKVRFSGFLFRFFESHDTVLTVRVCTASHHPTSIKGAHHDGAPAIATVDHALASRAGLCPCRKDGQFCPACCFPAVHKGACL